MGTPVLAPKPLYADRPAARIYGAFATRDEALEHSELVREKDPVCSLIVSPVNEWVRFPTNEIGLDAAYASGKIDEKLQEYHEKRRTEKIEFERAIIEKRRISEQNTQTVFETEDPIEEDEMHEAERLVYGPPKRLKTGAEVRGQASAVVVVIPDEFGEVLMKILGCFETTGEADKWCRDVGSRQVTEFDLLVVSTCEWFYPNGTGRCASNERYRMGELQRIMDAAKKNPQDVKDYKTWKKEQDELEERERAKESVCGVETPHLT